MDGVQPPSQPPAFRRLCQFTLVIVVLNIVTGAAVRLSDSGLGCPDWPTCSRHQLTPPLSLHPVIEFGNRAVVVVLVVACAAALIGAWRRSPFRKDLTWLAGGLILGVIGEAVLGGDRRVFQAQSLCGDGPLHGGHGPAGRGRGTGAPGRSRSRSGTSAGGVRPDAPQPGLHRPGRGGAGGRHGDHGDRSPRRRQGGQTDPVGPLGHDPHPRRDRPGHRRPCWCSCSSSGGRTRPLRSRTGDGSSWWSWSLRASWATPSTSPTCPPCWWGSTCSEPPWCGRPPCGSTTACPTTTPRFAYRPSRTWWWQAPVEVGT